MHRWAGGLLIAGTVLWSAGAAQALPIVGGETRIDFTDDIQKLVEGTLGATVSATGAATFDPERFAFSIPVTGGNSASGGLPGSVVTHDGSAVRVTKGETRFEFGEFVVDVDTALVISSVRSKAPAVDTPLDLPAAAAFFVGPNPEADGLPFALTVTPNGARNFNNTFGADALAAGDLVGTAGIDLEVVPVPAALPLLATAVGGLGFALHRRRRAAA